MKKFSFKKIWDTLSTVLVILIAVIAVLLAAARFTGFRAYTVLSGSMEPTYHVGSLIFVKSVDTKTIDVGDAITYLAGENTVVTHRVTAIVPDDEDSSILRFKTKGDANEAEDGTLVHENNVIGTPRFTIPVLGYIANYIQHPPGTYIAIAFALVILVFAFLPDDEERKKKSKT